MDIQSYLIAAIATLAGVIGILWTHLNSGQKWLRSELSYLRGKYDEVVSRVREMEASRHEDSQKHIEELRDINERILSDKAEERQWRREDRKQQIQFMRTRACWHDVQPQDISTIETDTIIKKVL